MTKKVAIVSAKRTALGSYLGSLKNYPASQLGAHLIQETLKSTNLKAESINEIFLGQVYTSNTGPNPARIAAINGGLAKESPATTINMVCGSGLQSIAIAAQSILSGENDLVFAGGMESMSQTPYLLSGAKDGLKMGDKNLVDSMIKDALWDSFYDCHMGTTAENLAVKYSISREEQDEYALLSQKRAQKAQESGLFKHEIFNFAIKHKKETINFDTDEYPRHNLTLPSLAKLKPCFKNDGTVTPGNSSGINDGASVLLLASEEACERHGLTPLVYVHSWSRVGVDPKIMGIGPAPAIQKLLKNASLNLDDINCFEINEAFAAQTLAVLKELRLNTDRVNVNGGALALGHPLAASGARISTTLIHEMKRKEHQYGVASLCVGGGMGIAMLFEQA